MTLEKRQDTDIARALSDTTRKAAVFVSEAEMEGFAKVFLTRFLRRFTNLRLETPVLAVSGAVVPPSEAVVRAVQSSLLP